MPEGLSPEEVGKEIAERVKPSGQDKATERRSQIISIAEAVLLSVVALLAAYSGYAAAKWSTESRVGLAEASAARSEANRTISSHRSFGTLTPRLSRRGLPPTPPATGRRWPWRSAASVRVPRRLEERGTRPETNPNAPRGPTCSPQYQQPGLGKAKALDKQAEDDFATAESAAETSDKYVRTTVYLASVLFLVGISTQFSMRRVRYGLIGLGGLMVVLSVVQLTQLPGPPASSRACPAAGDSGRWSRKSGG